MYSWVALGLIAAARCGIQLWATRSGIGVTPDGVAYLSIAEATAEGRAPFPSPLTAPSADHYAPGWALIVGFASWMFDLDVFEAARYVNVLVSALLPLTVYMAAGAFTGSRFRRVLLAAAISLLYPLRGFHALTEPLFVLLLLALAYTLVRAAQTHRDRYLYAAAGLIWASFLTRWVGLILVIPLLAVGMLVMTRRSLVVRIVNSATCVVLIGLPVAVWRAAAPWSSEASHHLASGARAGVADLVLSFQEAGRMVIGGQRLPSSAAALLGLFAVAGPLVAAAVGLRQLLGGTGWSLSHKARILVSSPIGISVLILLPYAALIGVQRWWIGREVIGRYWLPYLCLGLLVVVAVAAQHRSTLAHRFDYGLIGVVSFACIINVGQLLIAAGETSTVGSGLNEVRFRDSSVFRSPALAQHDIIYTDHPQLLVLHRTLRDRPLAGAVPVGCDWEPPPSGPYLAALFVECEHSSLEARVLNRPGARVVVDDAAVGTLIEVP